MPQARGMRGRRLSLNPIPPFTRPRAGSGRAQALPRSSRLRDQFIEQRLRNAISDESQYGNLTTELSSIQTAFNDNGSTGISLALGKFWDSWDQLVQDPGSLSNQTDVYQAAQNLATNIQSTYQRLNTIATDEIPGKLQDTVDQANTLINKIADLNSAIADNESTGFPANDLRDSRYQALSDLSVLIPVKYTENSSGVVTVTTTDASGPLTIVSGDTATPITVSSTITGGQFGGLTTSLQDPQRLHGPVTRFCRHPHYPGKRHSYAKQRTGGFHRHGCRHDYRIQ